MTRVNRLIEYVRGLYENKNGRELYFEYKNDIEEVTPQECFEIFHNLLTNDYSATEIFNVLDKVINVFYKSLSSYQWEKPENDNFLLDLTLENEALIQKTNAIKSIIKDDIDFEVKKEKLIPKIEDLKKFDDHYLKKENILFPYMEKAMPKFEGTSIMWALHDIVREQLKNTINLLKDKSSTEIEVNKALGELFFGMLGIVKKEDLILFPSASEVLSRDIWYKMHKQSLEYGFPFIDKNIDEVEHKIEESSQLNIREGEYKIKTKTGELSFEDVLLIFNTLPVDITFVDEHNKVKYFSDNKDRIFPRSPAVIGREVKNCHPPASVHVVEEIVESFRSGKEDMAKFWINMKGRKILIQYFALRDKNNNYKGTLEVSQDITEIKELEGERRLLKFS
ncbi:PAS domain-containing protein [Tissierella sp. Yu-01]|uniref:DUF438 domain-containing protein n=1 Tax=Tissierella sp. Yu-01 TaxID=3035694 RepID=UPI00240D6024|nr:PAS domain-containing protein [Tissierella sp. Yu-01]WFA08333.1 PAS domain-containing protein [Tissierella sp. Yu-01]